MAEEHQKQKELDAEAAAQEAAAAAEKDTTRIDPMVLNLARQLAASESPRITPAKDPTEYIDTGDEIIAAQNIAEGVGLGSGLTQSEMARLLAGLAAAEKIQYKDQPGGLEAPGSGPRSSDKARRPKKRTSGRRPSAQANSVDSPRAGTSISAAQWASRSRDEDGITLDALGLSVQDTRAAADGEGV